MVVDAGEATTLSDLPLPSMPVPITLAGPPVPPKQRIFFYSPAEWEEFILEWATGLKHDDQQRPYIQIKRLGGTGDGGIDVAAFKTSQQLEGPWDCLQCKHYVKELTFSDAAKEMLKMLRHVELGDYILPDRYLFLAPQGPATSLNRLLSTPTKLRAKFLENLDPDKALVQGLEAKEIAVLKERAERIEYSMFQAVQLHEVVEVHRGTPYYAARFGEPVVQRSTPTAPPATIAETETQYIAELRRVYAEKDPDGVDRAAALSEHPTYGRHFQRQRVSFYKAESLRMDTRDAVPDGTFEALQDDVFDGVIEVVDSGHPSGLDRLANVLTHATSLTLGQHPLVSITKPDDLKGICHQLANDSRLTWMGNET